MQSRAIQDFIKAFLLMAGYFTQATRLRVREKAVVQNKTGFRSHKETGGWMLTVRIPGWEKSWRNLNAAHFQAKFIFLHHELRVKAVS